MKQLLFLLALTVLAGCGKAQSPGTKLMIDDNDSSLISGTIVLDTASFLRINDTVRVVMLLCDTSVQHMIDPGIYNNPDTHNYLAYWQYGYIIYSNCNKYVCDDKFKRLPPNIIIWDYRELNTIK